MCDCCHHVFTDIRILQRGLEVEAEVWGWEVGGKMSLIRICAAQGGRWREMEREESEGRKCSRRVFPRLRRQIVCHRIVSATAADLLSDEQNTIHRFTR